MQPLVVSRRLWWALAGVVALVALASSLIGILNGFAYDDMAVIVRNTAIDALPRWWKMFTWSYWPRAYGGDGYRPLTILGFAIQWALGGGKPLLFHAVNITLYVAVSIGVFRVASMLMPIGYAVVAGALFAAHPVHVEAVANVVGQAEITVAVFVVFAVALYVRWRNADLLDAKRMAVIGAMYFVACFFKENAIVLPALLMAAETLVVDPRIKESRLARLQRFRPFWLALAALGLLYLLIRSRVLGNFSGFLLFVPFEMEKLGTADRILTMIGLVPVWVRLFLWPAHLRSEYAPPEFPLASGFEITQLPGFVLLAGFLGLMFALHRREPVIAFGLLWVAITLLPVSNFLIPTGILIAERTLFLPSVGVVLALAGAMPAVAARIPHPSMRSVGYAAVWLLVAAGAARSFTRTPIWRDNDTLFHRTVVDAPNSYRSHYMLGGLHFSQARPNSGTKELLAALRLYPLDPFIAYNLGEEYRKAGLFKSAEAMFKHALQVAPDYRLAVGRLAMSQANLGKFEEARENALEAIRRGDPDRQVMREIILAAAAVRRGEDPFGSGKLPEPVHNAPLGTAARTWKD